MTCSTESRVSRTDMSFIRGTDHSDSLLASKVDQSCQDDQPRFPHVSFDAMFFCAHVLTRVFLPSRGALSVLHVRGGATCQAAWRAYIIYRAYLGPYIHMSCTLSPQCGDH